MKSISLLPYRLNRSCWPVLAILVGAFLIFEFTPFDLWLQDFFFDFGRRRWVVDGEARLPRLFFYDGPKAALIVFGIGVLVLASGPKRWRVALGLSEKRKSLWIVFATLATGPILIGFGKSTTNIFCPAEITRYGGDVAYVRVMDCYPEGAKPDRRGRCFPAGHASGGFALLALAGLGRSRREQWLGIGVGAAAGLWMGVYQMLKGSHYLSHTVVTALVLWMVFLAWRLILGAAAESDEARFVHSNSPSGVDPNFWDGSRTP